MTSNSSSKRSDIDHTV